MPWQETEPMTERLQCIAAYLHQGDAMTGAPRSVVMEWMENPTACTGRR
jgi:hypothetical protein